MKRLLARQGRLALRIAVALVLLAAAVEVPLRAAGLELRVAAGPDSVTAEAVDGLGRAAAGAVVSFQLPAAGASGQFANGVQNEIVVAGPDGRATVKGIRWDPAARVVPIRVTAARSGERAATVIEWRRAGAPAGQDTVAVVEPAEARAIDLATSEEIPTYRGGGGGWGKRMLWIAAAAGGGAAAALLVRSRSGASPGTVPSAGAVTAPAGITIGSPIITVGKP